MTEQEIIDQAIEIKHHGDFIECSGVFINIKHISYFEGCVDGTRVYFSDSETSYTIPVSPEVFAFKIKLMQGYEE